VDVIPGDLVTPIPVTELQRRLDRLRRRDREFTQEQGINVLFLAVGFLSWVADDSTHAKAPVILVPCDLERASPRDPFCLRREEDDAVINATLKHQLSLLGVSLPEFDPGGGINAYLDQVDRRVAHRQGWSVTKEFVLGTFQYSKLAMWEDLERLKTEDITHPLVRSLAGDKDAEQPVNPTGNEWFNLNEDDLVGGRLDDHVDLRRQFLVLPADYSQVQAVGAAQSGQHLVVHGPPGTGKSQTIANIISTFIASGKTVLFVSEKTAALDVVKDRLDKCKLGVFCLDMHSERGKKANVYRQLKSSLEDSRSVADIEIDYQSLQALRTKLNSYVRALHQRRAPIGQSAYQIHGRFARVREAPDVDFPVRQPLNLDEQGLGELRRLGQRLAARPMEFAQHLTSRWLPLRPMSDVVSASTQVRRDMDLVKTTVVGLRTLSTEVAGWLGARPAQSCSDLASNAALAAHLASAPGVPSVWLADGVTERLIARATKLRQDQQHRSTLLQQLATVLRAPIPALDFETLEPVMNCSLLR
jgi:hypothetical protein